MLLNGPALNARFPTLLPTSSEEPSSEHARLIKIGKGRTGLAEIEAGELDLGCAHHPVRRRRLRGRRHGALETMREHLWDALTALHMSLGQPRSSSTRMHRNDNT